jgi:hypothetical protein
VTLADAELIALAMASVFPASLTADIPQIETEPQLEVTPAPNSLV